MKLKENKTAVNQLGIFAKPEEKTKKPADYDVIDMGVHQQHPPKDLHRFVLKKGIEKASGEEKPVTPSNGL